MAGILLYCSRRTSRQITVVTMITTIKIPPTIHHLTPDPDVSVGVACGVGLVSSGMGVSPDIGVGVGVGVDASG